VCAQCPSRISLGFMPLDQDLTRPCFRCDHGRYSSIYKNKDTQWAVRLQQIWSKLLLLPLPTLKLARHEASHRSARLWQGIEHQSRGEERMRVPTLALAILVLVALSASTGSAARSPGVVFGRTSSRGAVPAAEQPRKPVEPGSHGAVRLDASGKPAAAATGSSPPPTVFDADRMSKRRVRRGSDPIHNKCWLLWPSKGQFSLFLSFYPILSLVFSSLFSLLSCSTFWSSNLKYLYIDANVRNVQDLPGQASFFFVLQDTCWGSS
jgi:hypothetical protein